MTDPTLNPEGQHKNDMYGNIEARSEHEAGVQPPIPAATVVLLRDGGSGVEVLMLKKNSKITFGGMWVFPGGKIDAQDHQNAADHDQAARYAAARETLEETGLQVEPSDFEWFAHWTPPPGPAKRFATWFFAARISGDDNVMIDDGEIKDHAWISPADALNKHKLGEIDLVPPTWVTLYHLSRYAPAEKMLSHFQENPAKVYATRVVKDVDGTRVALWHGDSGYDSWDAQVPGHRHRLIMAADGFEFINSVESY
jgi:8-oxo-dGTP pyrophosphatase MutT (NUDIX family)